MRVLFTFYEDYIILYEKINPSFKFNLEKEVFSRAYVCGNSTPLLILQYDFKVCMCNFSTPCIRAR